MNPLLKEYPVEWITETPTEQGAAAVPTHHKYTITPEEPAVSRNQVAMRERMRQHRFYHQFASDLCAVTQQSSIHGGLVHVAHMLPFRGASYTSEFEYAFGYPFRNSLNSDSRLNGMFLWSNIHDLLDADTLVILFTNSLLNRVSKLVLDNLMAPMMDRKYLPYILDQEMPINGWEYQLVFRFAAGFESIKRHKLEESALGLTPSKAFKIHGAHKVLRFRAATSPLFVLANFHEHILKEEGSPPNWPYPNDNISKMAEAMGSLLINITQRVLPAEFKPMNRLTKLRSSSSKAAYTHPLPSYNYMTGLTGSSELPDRQGTPEPNEPQPADVAAALILGVLP
ncbi:hypothetical protein BDN71DRAFT_1440982 [Pleurotus eryngii]|uniref:HNH nuclease domain-containing protein n=1 Tax=Pleurotus eryngii TaxID=5323 RepID=A0A9P6DJX6_PLEER|nr:hypothetical protein BDN71DRAFT_1440982 [Pleurotus eryngii]